MTKETTPKKHLWEKVLIEFARARFYQNGLTLPFLIGSSVNYRPNEPIIGIHEILTQICSNAAKVSLIHCEGIGEPVFSMLDAETQALLEKSPGIFKCFGNLVIVDGSLAEISSSAQLIDYFFTRYHGRITLGIYSKNGRWGNFSSLDLAQLEQVKSLVLVQTPHSATTLIILLQNQGLQDVILLMRIEHLTGLVTFSVENASSPNITSQLAQAGINMSIDSQELNSIYMEKTKQKILFSTSVYYNNTEQ